MSFNICQSAFYILLILVFSHAPRIAFAQEEPARTLDIRILESIAETRTPAQNATFHFISDSHNYMQIAIPAGLFIAGAISDDKQMRQNAGYVISSTAVTALLNIGLKQVFKRSRPFKKYNNFTALSTPGSFSFPSGHTSAAFSTATALSHAYPKWYVIAPAMLWAGSVGYSRMYLGVHYTSDVAAGAALGAGTALGMGFMKK
ncbi:phosphatase PAP2 family protein [Sphingobacterium spiritivorum]|uniref:PAP2 family protein n=1 Tax=Sphingobacterium spiritivorum ATCC 33861 TaxID=525373 RepID=D7VRJ5_SPHSI|nr:phosphatase PAP2 family protein [Sphingobacterium spiritivorum]EFK56396.1 PAP2 family protein [Sphingobacterium spiritivorum ATCC 33861]QQT35525.1 phosphatase PAP2 family protein [Sphingobacterium spiritivorum]WQD32221.1 phosphatase PAP2 family protein [Sphingobacterium spiritivorum]SUJ06785.1 undecaprenyl pyrophosphate phosphatase [Sphingobacterium spiritivorum]